MSERNSKPFYYGYVRVSTPTQSLERQIRNIEKATEPIGRKVIFFKEKYTGTTKEGRKEFARLLSVVRPGDTIYFDSVCRMSRNAAEGFMDYEALFEKGVNLIFLKEPHINTDVYRQALAVKIPLTSTSVDIILEAVQRYTMEIAKEHIRMAFTSAEQEVQTLRARTKEGIETARLKGKQIGQVPGKKLTTKKSKASKEKIKKYSKAFGGTMKDVELIDFCHITPNTYYKYKRELLEEMEGNHSE